MKKQFLFIIRQEPIKANHLITVAVVTEMLVRVLQPYLILYLLKNVRKNGIINKLVNGYKKMLILLLKLYVLLG